MQKQLGSLRVECDAPPYEVVQACRLIGIQAPEDVRWCQVKPEDFSPAEGWFGSFFVPWQAFRKKQRPSKLCSCGHPMPEVRDFCFLLPLGVEVFYALGQCSRCHAVYWS